jgi:hypothetical protein
MQYLGRLTALDLSHNNLSSLDHMPLGLRTLDVSHNNLAALSGLTSLRQLQTVDCSHNVLETLAGLPPTSTLHVVIASHNRLSSAKGLEGCTGLRELNVAANLIASANQLSVLGSLHSLRVLDVGDNPCVTRSPDRAHADLRSLFPRCSELRGVFPPARSPPRDAPRAPHASRPPSDESFKAARPDHNRQSVVMAPGSSARRAPSQGSNAVPQRRTPMETPDESTIMGGDLDTSGGTLRPAHDSSAGTIESRSAASHVRDSFTESTCPRCAALTETNADLARQLAAAKKTILGLQQELQLAQRSANQAHARGRVVEDVRRGTPAGVDLSTSKPSAHLAVPPSAAATRGGGAAPATVGHQTQNRPTSAQPLRTQRAPHVSLAGTAAAPQGTSGNSAGTTAGRASSLLRTAPAPTPAPVTTGTLARSRPLSYSPQQRPAAPPSAGPRSLNTTAPPPTSARRPSPVSSAQAQASAARRDTFSSSVQHLQQQQSYASLGSSRRPASADARRAARVSNGTGLAGAPAPVPTLQRSRSADPFARPRSADTTISSLQQKSVSFGPNQYFSPPSHYR